MNRKTSLVVNMIIILILLPLTCLAASKDPLLAKIGDEEIRESDFNRYIAPLPPQAKKHWKGTGKEIILNRMIEEKLYLKGARMMKFSEKPDVKARIQDQVNNILISEYVKHLEAGIKKVEESDIEKYYKENQAQFKIPERVKILHIAVKSKEDAEKVLASLKAGVDFSKVAKNESIYSSKKRGANLGWVHRGMIQPELEKVAFTLKDGELSDIIHTERGYHIIKVEGHRKAGMTPLDNSLRTEIRAKLIKIRRNQVIVSNLEKLKKQLGVKIYYKKP